MATVIGVPEVPFVAGDGLIHRVAADTARSWIKCYGIVHPVATVTQCGAVHYGCMHPIGSLLVSCLACVSRELRGARWPAEVGDRYVFTYAERDARFNTQVVVVRTSGDDPEGYVYFDDGTYAKQRHLDHVGRVW